MFQDDHPPVDEPDLHYRGRVDRRFRERTDRHSPYMLAPIGFMLVILIDPAGIASRLKARSGRQGATAGRSESVADGWQASGNGWSLTFQRKRGLTRGAARSIIAAAARERAADSCRR